MSFIHGAAKLGVGGAALALAATIGLGFTPPQLEEQLPTVKVWHDPT